MRPQSETDQGEIIHSENMQGGAHWSLTIRAGFTLRLTDIEGGANVGMLFYNPANPLERYNAPDTLKCQHTFKLTRGNCLYSDMGRIFCSIVEDTHGWHDTVCGNSTRASLKSRYGSLTYQHYRNERAQNGLDSFLVEAAKYGLGKKDLAANVNWFSTVRTDIDGALGFDPDVSSAGARVELRFEMDTLVLFHTCPHPLDPSPTYSPKPIHCELFEALPVAEDDFCRTSRPENGRGFENTELYRRGLSVSLPSLGGN
ncbi:MAG: urea amidolyase associated protein UAAP1 [Candidatus Phaeomarinobacter sp.]